MFVKYHKLKYYEIYARKIDIYFSHILHVNYSKMSSFCLNNNYISDTYLCSLRIKQQLFLTFKHIKKPIINTIENTNPNLSTSDKSLLSTSDKSLDSSSMI